MHPGVTGTTHPLVPVAFLLLVCIGFPTGGIAQARLNPDLGTSQLGASGSHEVAQPGNSVAHSSAPMNVALVSHLPEPSDACSADSEGRCAPTRNVQERVQYEDGTWGTVSYTCQLRKEITIPVASIGFSLGPISVSESFNLLAFGACEYGPRCGSHWWVDVL